MDLSVKQRTLALFFALVCAVSVNWIGLRVFRVVDVTADSYFTLSDTTRQVLGDLVRYDRRVSVTVFVQPTHPSFSDIRLLLDRYTQASEHITVQFIDPERDPLRAKQLVERYSIKAMNTLVFECDLRQRILKTEDLYIWERKSPLDPVPPKILGYRGEDAITSSLLGVSESDPTVAYFTIGHDERRINKSDTLHLSKVRDLMRQNHMTVKEWDSRLEPDVPEDADLIVIVRPRQLFLPSELDAIDGFFQNGGSVLVMADAPVDVRPVQRANLNLRAWLKRYGIVMGNNLVVEQNKKLAALGPGFISTRHYGKHPITSTLRSNPAILQLARTVNLIDQKKENRAGAELIFSSKTSWAETNLTQLKDIGPDEGEKTGELSMGVALVEETSPGTLGRMVVWGNSAFISNQAHFGLDNASNQHLLLNSIAFLTRKAHHANIPAKKPEHIRLSMTQDEVNTIFIFVMVVIPGLAGLFGLLVFVWQRRGQAA